LSPSITVLVVLLGFLAAACASSMPEDTRILETVSARTEILVGFQDWDSMVLYDPRVIDPNDTSELPPARSLDRDQLARVLDHVNLTARELVTVDLLKTDDTPAQREEIETYFKRLGFARVEIEPAGNPSIGRDNNGDGPGDFYK